MYSTTKFDRDKRFALTGAEKLCVTWALKQMVRIRPKKDAFWISAFIIKLYPSENIYGYLHKREARTARLSIRIFGGAQFVKPNSQVLTANLLEKLDFMLSKRNPKSGR